jgi:hypothetical protein
MTASYRARFDELVRELRACPEILVEQAEIGPPTSPAVLAEAQETAGLAWPEGMDALYAEISSFDLEWEHRSLEDLGGGVHLPRVERIWDYAALEGDLWFDFLGPQNPLHRIRPVDRFVPEACAVIYPVPGAGPAEVHYHYCGESLVPTGLSYRAWLDQLFLARGVSYWLQIFTGPRGAVTWVEQAHDAFAKLFPDFDPLGPGVARERIPLDD